MVNVIPLNDERTHQLSSDCWCDPHVGWKDGETGLIFKNAPLVVHNSVDCREFVERAIGIPIAEDKKWGIYV